VRGEKKKNVGVEACNKSGVVAAMANIILRKLQH